MRRGEPQLGPAMADSGLPVETPPPLGETTDESGPGLPTPAETLRRAALGARSPSQGFALRRDPTPVRMIRGPFAQGPAHRDQRMFHVERAGGSAQSLERQFHVEQSQVLTSGRRQARIGGVPRRFRSPT
jgi:hypothetical protein